MKKSVPQESYAAGRVEDELHSEVGIHHGAEMHRDHCNHARCKARHARRGRQERCGKHASEAVLYVGRDATVLLRHQRCHGCAKDEHHDADVIQLLLCTPEQKVLISVKQLWCAGFEVNSVLCKPEKCSQTVGCMLGTTVRFKNVVL